MFFHLANIYACCVQTLCYRLDNYESGKAPILKELLSGGDTDTSKKTRMRKRGRRPSKRSGHHHRHQEKEEEQEKSVQSFREHKLGPRYPHGLSTRWSQETLGEQLHNAGREG